MYLFFCLVQKLKDRRLLEYVRYTQLNVFRIYSRRRRGPRRGRRRRRRRSEGTKVRRRRDVLKLLALRLVAV